ncbi:MAG: type I phosphodiesterase/nucleotide pyrophosphatase [archaeon GW2011_AR9]|nr:MAG: type I phosphodiesterase/nucleotide pyrophosphatase [archaeon GW2011_AR9]HIH13307.1 alkaline phosphatase family protein [Candidatus Woesearchaeota archaeon]
MPPPHYQRNSIVNLMSTILHSFGAKSTYPPLSNLLPELQQADNIILFIIDGLGVDSFQKLGKNSILQKHYQQTLTSVFPSATTAAITTFMTGLAPQGHGFISWDMYMAEFGSIVQILPFQTQDKKPLKKVKLSVPPSLFHALKTLKKADTHVVMKKSLLKSPYNTLFCKDAQQHPFNNMSGMIRALRQITHSRRTQKQYIYAYWGGFDDLSHAYGKNHPKSFHHLQQLDRAVQFLTQQLEGTNTLLLITADHGQITTTPKKTIILNNHPVLMEGLALPPGGEPRAVICYVHPHKAQKFTRYVEQQLKAYCTLYQSAELAKQGYFGLGKLHPQFKERIGDYILIPKENYVLRYFLRKEKALFMPGHHGGLSEEEMLVPLIKIDL